MDVLFTDDYEAIRTFLDKHSDLVNAINVDNKTSLYIASENNRNDVVDLLILKGADINLQCGFHKRTALYIATEMGCVDIVTKLLMANADPNISDKYGNIAISAAAYTNNLDLVKFLTVPSDLSKINDDKSTIITLPVLCNYTKVVEYLLDFIDINYVDGRGWSYLHYAVHRRREETIDLLLKRGIDINLENDEGQTALQMADSDSIRNLFAN